MYHIYLAIKQGFLLPKMTPNMLISPMKFYYKIGVSRLKQSQKSDSIL